MSAYGTLHRILNEWGWECKRITGSHHIFRWISQFTMYRREKLILCKKKWICDTSSCTRWKGSVKNGQGCFETSMCLWPVCKPVYFEGYTLKRHSEMIPVTCHEINRRGNSSKLELKVLPRNLWKLKLRLIIDEGLPNAEKTPNRTVFVK